MLVLHRGRGSGSGPIWVGNRQFGCFGGFDAGSLDPDAGSATYQLALEKSYHPFLSSLRSGVLLSQRRMKVPILRAAMNFE